jgi:WhiB family redox-sensing transcriptional regulator
MIAPTVSELDEIVDLRPEGHDPSEADEPEPRLLAGEDTWWAHARCNDGSGRLATMFFSEELQDIARAKNICATCPALIPCLEGALERREPWGVWGGQLFLNGKILATKRRRGRPPKLPRPEDQLPDIPIPDHLQDVAIIRIA